MNQKFVIKGKTIIVGIGNTLRSDDGFGPELIERIKDKVDAVCIDAGSAPENYLGRIVRENPGAILIVDAVCLGLFPGEYRILQKEDVLNNGLGTHNIPLPMFIEYLEQHTAADIYILAVQPQSLSLGGEMSEKVKRALLEVEEFLLRNLEVGAGPCVCPNQMGGK